MRYNIPMNTVNVWSESGVEIRISSKSCSLYVRNNNLRFCKTRIVKPLHIPRFAQTQKIAFYTL